MSTQRYRPLPSESLSSLPHGTVVTVRDGERWAVFFCARTDHSTAHFLPTVAVRPSSILVSARHVCTDESLTAAADFTIIEYEDEDQKLCQAVKLPIFDPACWFAVACGAEHEGLQSFADLLHEFDRLNYLHSVDTKLGVLIPTDGSVR